MGLRFRQRIKVFPGVHLNVSLGGMSVSMGGPGATVNVGRGMRVRGTVGLPGTGLSYQDTLHPGTANRDCSHHTAGMPDAASSPLGWTEEKMDVHEYSEQKPNSLTGAAWTPPELVPVQNLIIEAHQERQALDAELAQLQQRVDSATASLEEIDTWWGRWFSKPRIQRARSALQEAQTDYAHLQNLEREQGLPITWSVDQGLQRCYDAFSKDMRSMLNHARGWHVLEITDNGVDNRAWHSSPMMHRSSCSVEFGRPAFFAATGDPLYKSAPCITCTDGLALYFYPTFILVQREDAFGLLLPQDLDIAIDDLRVAEHDPAFASAQVDEYTWHYVNKNGTPDLRHTHNLRVPLLDYQRLTLSSPQGLHETFLFSDNVYAFASWLGVRDWYEASHKYNALQEIPITLVQWSVRQESDATYFVAQHEGKELLGFGFTRRTDQFWVCLNTEPLGVVLDSGCAFFFWLDGQRLELGNYPGITRRLGRDDAAFRVCADKEGQDRAFMQQCLGNTKELIILVESNHVPVVRLYLALADPAPYWQALQNIATAE